MLPPVVIAHPPQPGDFYDRYLQASIEADGYVALSVPERRVANNLGISYLVDDTALEDGDAVDDADDEYKDEGDSVGDSEGGEEADDEYNLEDGWLVADDADIIFDDVDTTTTTDPGYASQYVPETQDDKHQGHDTMLSDDEDTVLLDFPMTSPAMPASDATSDVDEVSRLSPLTDIIDDDDADDKPLRRSHRNGAMTRPARRRLRRTRTLY